MQVENMTRQLSAKYWLRVAPMPASSNYQTLVETARSDFTVPIDADAAAAHSVEVQAEVQVQPLPLVFA